MIFDTHCHLHDFRGDVGAVWNRAREHGVVRAVNVGTNAKDAAAAQAVAKQLPGVYLAAGLHPVNADRFAAEWPALLPIVTSQQCVAIGETGLDLYRPTNPSLKAQMDSLEHHLELGARLKRPVILHCRPQCAGAVDSIQHIHDILLATLRAHSSATCVLHCFSGTAAEAKAASDLGHYVSFAGTLTYSGSIGTMLRQAASVVSPDRILVETDAPYVKPIGCTTRRNEPCQVRLTLRTLAQTLRWDFEHACAVTTRNADTFYRLTAETPG
jgi:TatD DNase family protein